MKSTFFDLGDAQRAPEHLANGYYWDLEAKRFKDVLFINVTELGGSAAVLSNVLDYAKWLRCLIQEDGPFSENVHAEIRIPRVVTGPPAGPYGTMMYGLGWELTTYQNNIVYKHDGAMHAYGAHVVWIPDHKYGVVSFGNTAQTSSALEDSLTMHLIEEKLGIPLKDRYNVTEECVFGTAKWTSY
jgi:CubicO group peptidase (beta-lactamase class C family)